MKKVQAAISDTLGVRRVMLRTLEGLEAGTVTPHLARAKAKVAEVALESKRLELVVARYGLSASPVQLDA